MKNERFKGYDKETREAVLNFERNEQEGSSGYYDEEVLEMIIDFYLDSGEIEMLETAVGYGLRLYPQSCDMRLRHSHLLCVKGEYAKALHILEELEATEPGNCDVLYALGAVHSALDEPRQAIDYYEQAMADGYDLATICGNIGDEYANMGMHDKAVEYYKRSIDYDSHEERSLDNLGASLEAENRGSEAVDYFERFVKEEPYSRMGWYSLASAYYAELKLDKAVEAFQYALAIDDTFTDAYIGLADCYRAMSKTSQAVETLREMLPHTTDKSMVYHNIACVYQEADNLDTAIIYHKKAIDEAPYFAQYWTETAFCFLYLGDHGNAMDYAERGAHLDPQSGYCLWSAGHIFAQCHNDEQAVEYYEIAVALCKDDENVWIEYADLLMRMERYADAIDLLHEGLPHCQQAYSFYARLAVCYYKTGQRNFLGNALRACMQYKDTYGLSMLFILCPEMENDIDVINTIYDE
ncbi:MAG: tetratricopeptide repeat protein [Bacteroidales bacterium]|nr:tetratricopeptide repeat protein [Bacteroidales bacterium]